MSTHSLTLEEIPAAPTPDRKGVYLRLLLMLAALIFLAEVAIMVLLYFLDIDNYILNALLDGILMLVIIFPALYRLQLKPILTKMDEQARIEDALRTSEAFLKKVMEALPVGVWITGKNGEILHGNPSSQEIWAGARYVGINGYREYKARWADTGEWIQPHEWAGARAIQRGETSINEEISIEAFDGSAKTILNSAVPILDDRGEILGAVVVNQDITQRRQMEKDLVRTNALLERLADNIHTAVAFLDRDFNFVRVNQAYARGAGLPVEYFNGKNHFELYPHEENEAIFRRVVETGDPYFVFEKPFEYPDDPTRGVTYWDWSLQPVMDANNQVEGLVFSLVDVTRRKLAELQLERQNQELRELTVTEHKERVMAEGLVQSAIALNQSLELDLVLTTVLEQVRKVIAFEGADILLVKGSTWRTAAYLGFEDFPEYTPNPNQRRTFEGYPLLQKVCSALQVVVISSVTDHPGWRADPALSWVRSYTAVPLVIDGAAMGVVELYSRRPDAFNEETVTRLAAFAAPAALALHNARRYRAETDARKIAETMSAAALALTQSLELDHAVNTLLDHIHLLVDCDTAGVTLMEAGEKPSRHSARGYGLWAGRSDIPTFPIEEHGVLRQTRTSHRAFILSNASSAASHGTGPDPIHTWAVLPIIAGDKVSGYVELGRSGQEMFPVDQMRWAETLVLQASVAIQNAWLFQQVQSSSVRLQLLARKLVELQESERRSIARELHDEAGQVLSFLKFSLGRMEQEADCPPQMRDRLKDLKSAADGVMEGIHRLAMDLRPAVLDHLGLAPALQQLAGQLNSEGLSVQFKAVGMDRGRLPQEVETSLYRIGQEALTNVVDHAQAHTVGVLLERAAGKVRLFVEDDGIGFMPERGGHGDRLGLIGMRERAEMLGGSLQIETSPGCGTSIIVEVPDGDTNPDHG